MSKHPDETKGVASLETANEESAGGSYRENFHLAQKPNRSLLTSLSFNSGFISCPLGKTKAWLLPAVDMVLIPSLNLSL